MIYTVAAVAIFIAVESLMHTHQPHANAYRPPANWKFAAAQKGHTFHAKGCPGVPNLPAEQMVYGNSVREMENCQKEPCPWCIK